MAIDGLPESPEQAQPLPPVQPAQPVQPVVPKGRHRGSNWGTVLLGLAAIVAVGGIAFAAGRLTAPASTSARGAGLPGGYPGASLLPGASFAPDANGRPAGALGLGGAQMTLAGTISAISGDTLTLTTESGQTIEVNVADAAWHGQVSASASDVAVGTQVQVQLSAGLGRDPGAGQEAGASPDPNAGGVPATGSLSASEVTILQE
jgi:uncharacterized protein YdeI (BOF family)